jgi:hypothetical protein
LTGSLADSIMHPLHRLQRPSWQPYNARLPKTKPPS